MRPQTLLIVERDEKQDNLLFVLMNNYSYYFFMVQAGIPGISFHVFADVWWFTALLYYLCIVLFYEFYHQHVYHVFFKC